MLFRNNTVRGSVKSVTTAILATSSYSRPARRHHSACQELSAALWIGQIKLRLLPNSRKFPGRTTQSTVSLFNMTMTISLVGQSGGDYREKGHRSRFVRRGDWRGIIKNYKWNLEGAGGKWARGLCLTTLRASVPRPEPYVSVRERERARDHLHVEDFIRTLGLPCDVADFIGGLGWQRGRGVAVDRGVAEETEGERKTDREGSRWLLAKGGRLRFIFALTSDDSLTKRRR